MVKKSDCRSFFMSDHIANLRFADVILVKISNIECVNALDPIEN
jgi:hypothetical protein